MNNKPILLVFSQNAKISTCQIHFTGTEMRLMGMYEYYRDESVTKLYLSLNHKCFVLGSLTLNTNEVELQQ